MDRELNCGVPQGSVLGLDLWNALYDDLLAIELSPDVELIAFADDVALIASASVVFLLEEALEKVATWMVKNDLELALDKTEVILLTNWNAHKSMTVRHGTHTFHSKRCIKYLGIQLDAILHFSEHAELVARRAADA